MNFKLLGANNNSVELKFNYGLDLIKSNGCHFQNLKCYSEISVDNSPASLKQINDFRADLSVVTDRGTFY